MTLLILVTFGEGAVHDSGSYEPSNSQQGVPQIYFLFLQAELEYHLKVLVKIIRTDNLLILALVSNILRRR